MGENLDKKTDCEWKYEPEIQNKYFFLNNGRKEGAEVMTEAMSILTDFEKKSLSFFF